MDVLRRLLLDCKSPGRFFNLFHGGAAGGNDRRMDVRGWGSRGKGCPGMWGPGVRRGPGRGVPGAAGRLCGPSRGRGAAPLRPGAVVLAQPGPSSRVPAAAEPVSPGAGRGVLRRGEARTGDTHTHTHQGNRPPPVRRTGRGRRAEEEEEFCCTCACASVLRSKRWGVIDLMCLLRFRGCGQKKNIMVRSRCWEGGKKGGMERPRCVPPTPLPVGTWGSPGSDGLGRGVRGPAGNSAGAGGSCCCSAGVGGSAAPGAAASPGRGHGRQFSPFLKMHQ